VSRKINTYKLQPHNTFKKKLVEYLRHYDSFCLLDSNSSDSNSLDFLVAFSKEKELIDSSEPFLDLDMFINESSDWMFGYLTYELKNYVEELSSDNLDLHKFPIIHFFTAQIIINVKKQDVSISYTNNYSSRDIDKLFSIICLTNENTSIIPKVSIKSRVEKGDYINNIIEIKKHLKSGDIYEMNYCQEFYSDNCEIDPFLLFSTLNTISNAPFSSFYRINEHFCICASPERYLKKTGSRIISQPIKGTIKKSDNPFLDKENQNILLNSSKDLSENVMIVDLVRNDLSRIAKKGTVKVDELTGLYTYKDVHHLISTISCELDSKSTIVDAVQASFPMGSMTGAPKIKAMELIEKFEDTLRGLYSGSIGYINPEKDFDFNVVIRSVFYNQQSQYLSFMVGGAITIDSDPELEYEECLAKAKSIFKVLTQ
tara:strand:- start:38 stop:1321 length:1284 start_codon:yes stop_codon:yes gene_type:complete